MKIGDFNEDKYWKLSRKIVICYLCDFKCFIYLFKIFFLFLESIWKVICNNIVI